MTQEEKRSAIKRINQRLADFNRGDVKLDYDAKKYRERINALIPANLRTKSGNISHGDKALEQISEETLQALSSAPTRGQILAQARKAVAQEEGKSEKSVTNADVQAYIDKESFVRETAESAPSLLSDALATANVRTGQRTSYDTLYNAITAYQAGERKATEKIRRDVLAKYFD